MQPGPALAGRGIWDRILCELQTEAAHDEQIDDSITMIDSTSIRARQHAAGRETKGPR
jgi:hypothetical protein